MHWNERDGGGLDLRRGRAFRIDRTRGTGTGHANRRHAEEFRQSPPGHAERIAAHEARVAPEVARLELCQGGRHGKGPKVRREAQEARRQRVARHLAGASGVVTRPELQLLLGVSEWSLYRLLQHPWFLSRRRVRRGAPKGGGHLPSVVSLTPEGRKAARRLAREGVPHADR